MDPASLPLAAPTLTLPSIGGKILHRFTWFAENLVTLLPLLAISLALAAVLVWVLIPRRTAFLLLFILALTAALYVINPPLATYSNHGMAHLGFVYATERLSWPPEDPYFAGASLHYPWAYHALVAGISSLLQLPPSWVFAGLNLAALTGTIAAVAGISRWLDGDEATANWAVVLTLLAPTLLCGGAAWVFRPLNPVPGLAFWEPNGLPPAEKYSNVSAMPLGMAIGVICLYNILSLFSKQNYINMNIILIFPTVVLVGHVYPHVWLCACVIVGVGVAVAARTGDRGKALALTTALLLGDLAVAPYLRDLTAGRAPNQGLGLCRDPRVYLEHLLHVALVLLPLWLLIAVRRRSLLERLRAGSRVHWTALASGLALLLAFLVLDAPGGSYKFRVMAVFCLAPLAAPGLKRIDDGNKPASVLILALQLLPFCHDGYSKTPRGWGHVAEPYSWQGTVLRHGVVEEDRLYQWIREHTPTTAILIDNRRSIPIYAQRSLFVARQVDWNADDWWDRRDGWMFSPGSWLKRIDAQPAAEIRRRNELVDALYRQTDPRLAEDLARQLDEMTADRPVFVVARDGPEKAALGRKPFLQKVAESSEWAVYALEKDQARNRGRSGARAKTEDAGAGSPPRIPGRRSPIENLRGHDEDLRHRPSRLHRGAPGRRPEAGGAHGHRLRPRPLRGMPVGARRRPRPGADPGHPPGRGPGPGRVRLPDAPGDR